MIQTFNEDKLWSLQGKGTKPIEYEVSENGCWNCSSHYSFEGNYSVITRFIHGRKIKTSMTRYIFELTNDRKIKEGFIVLHSCDNRRCINPHHLSEGTYSSNMHEKYERNRGNNARSFSLPQTKLSDSDVKKIRLLTEEGLSNSEVAKMFGISTKHARDIKNYKRRKNVW